MEVKDKPALKDGWDKFEKISNFLSVGLVSIFVFFISQCNQNKQQEIENNHRRIELLENLIPYLSSKDPMQNKVAIYTLSSLGLDTLASELASMINSPGTRAALNELSKDTTLSPKSKSLYKKKWDEVKNKPADTTATFKVLRNIDGTPLINVDGKLLLNENGQVLTTEDGKPILTE